MKKLLIIGAGGHGQVLAEVAMACGYDRVDFLDDRNPCAVGTTDRAEALAGGYDGVIVSIGNNDLRRTLIQRLQAVDGDGGEHGHDVGHGARASLPLPLAVRRAGVLVEPAQRYEVHVLQPAPAQLLGQPRLVVQPRDGAEHRAVRLDALGLPRRVHQARHLDGVSGQLLPPALGHLSPFLRRARP